MRAKKAMTRAHTFHLLSKSFYEISCQHRLEAAVRSGDYNTSRQLLILYTLVASKGRKESTASSADEDNKAHTLSNGNLEAGSDSHEATAGASSVDNVTPTPLNSPSDPLFMQNVVAQKANGSEGTLSKDHFIPAPPPPPELARAARETVISVSLSTETILVSDG